MNTEKQAVKDFWNRASCGEVYAGGDTMRNRLDAQAEERRRLEPYIAEFARYSSAKGKRVLEIGVGMGADHLEFAKAQPASLTGIDLTERAIEFTRSRLELYGFVPNIMVGDAEGLPFADDSFDIVYSFGVLHHTPNTAQAIREVYRVLAPGGVARIMIYHKYSITGYMLWLRYGLFAGKPARPLKEIYAHYLESPGTKAFTREESRQMFTQFEEVSILTQLCFGDLLEGEAGQRHKGLLLSLAKRFHPRWLIRRALPNHGLFMMIEARKQAR
ncbi:MAG: class I SAM-dependent methyltransferase [Terracidiphilus sp.]